MALASEALAKSASAARRTTMFLSILGILLISFVLLIVIAIGAKLTLGD